MNVCMNVTIPCFVRITRLVNFCLEYLLSSETRVTGNELRRGGRGGWRVWCVLQYVCVCDSLLTHGVLCVSVCMCVYVCVSNDLCVYVCGSNDVCV